MKKQNELASPTFAITGSDDTSKNLIKPIQRFIPTSRLFLNVNKLLIKKFEHAALIIAKGRILIKVNFVNQSERYKTVNCTNTPIKPTIPKLIALLGITLPRRE